MEERRPRVGVATVIKRDNKILLGHRLSQLGYDTWGLPGGKLEFGEDIKNCAIRELKEETNLITTTDNLKFIGVTNAVYDNETHYITIIYEVDVYIGKIKIMEPDKLSEWKFFAYNELPKNLFLPFKNFIEKENYKF
jgi:ADP-ribose pyrophosphatase YjhB (NUDIX family)